MDYSDSKQSTHLVRLGNMKIAGLHIWVEAVEPENPMQRSVTSQVDTARKLLTYILNDYTTLGRDD